MKPASPVYKDSEDLWGVKDTVIADNDPCYAPLPALTFGDGVIVTRWHMTWLERLSVLLFGDVYLSLATFHHPVPPMAMTTNGLDACTLSVDPEVHYTEE